MFCVYGPDPAEMSGLGLGILDPFEAEAEELAGGMYEVRLRQAIDSSGRHRLLECGRIIRCPAPAREAPNAVYEGTEGHSVTREVWKVTVDTYLYIRASPNGIKTGALHNGDRVMKLGEDNSSGSVWYKIEALKGGAAGWVFPNLTGASPYLTRDGSVTVTVGDDSARVIDTYLTRDQLFRVYSVETDCAEGFVEARARHITYDLAGAMVKQLTLQVSDTAANVCERLRDTDVVDHDAGIEIVCYAPGRVKLAMGARNAADILLSDTDGILGQTGARLVRDNLTLYLLPPGGTGRVTRVERGRNMLTGRVTRESDGIYDCIIPVGKRYDGTALVGNAVSTGDVPVITRTVVYPVTAAGDTDAQINYAKALLHDAALAELQGGAARAKCTLETDFADVALAGGPHLYDTVLFTDPVSGESLSAMMTGYTYDILRGRYIRAELEVMAGDGGI